ncbi:hypothetical protein [Streptomyces buecherae]|uniref:Uncharacterized protein n=1 Tax=Streptomyces buecherae TaxID=2763006 RepID=A0A7H8N9A9_9ACTN|nr:hypothetical protein [Streptomyces buecherae]QKW51050.1 hypothetical protein HUT08_17620 [Streptomyces buecherae]
MNPDPAETNKRVTTRDPAYGWRVDRIPGRPIEHVAERQGGGLALPLWVLLNGTYRGDVELLMSATEAADLYAELGRALEGGQTAAGSSPRGPEPHRGLD